MDKIVSKIVALGVPGLVLLLAIGNWICGSGSNHNSPVCNRPFWYDRRNSNTRINWTNISSNL